MKRSYYVAARREKTIKLFDFSYGIDGRKDDRLSPFNAAASSYNLRLSDGALKTGYGMQYASFPITDGTYLPALPAGVAAKRIYYYEKFDFDAGKRKDRTLVLCDDGYVYEYEVGTETGFKKVSILSFSSYPLGVNYRLNGEDVFIFATDGGLTVYDGTTATLYDAPEMTSVCVHGERLFVTSGREDTRLWFSDSFDPTNWYVSLKEAGFIDFLDGRGKLLKAISFKDYVYIFRNYGITRLTAYGDQEDFYAAGIEADRAKIYGETVADTGKVVFYLTDNGFYYFDGSSSGRVMRGLDKYLKGVDNSSAYAAFYDGKYFCSMKIRVDGELKNVILCYDDSENSWFLIKDFAFSHFISVYAAGQYKLFFAIAGRRLGELSSNPYFLATPLDMSWESKSADFDVPSRKTLERLRFYSGGEGTIRVKSDEGERSFKLSGDGLKNIAVGLKGVNFKISYSTSVAGAYLSKMSVKVNYFSEA